jgi:hypothetical protein
MNRKLAATMAKRTAGFFTIGIGDKVFKVNESGLNKNCPDSGDSFGFSGHEDRPYELEIVISLSCFFDL